MPTNLLMAITAAEAIVRHTFYMIEAKAENLIGDRAYHGNGVRNDS